jgi:hypothetical protein
MRSARHRSEIDRERADGDLPSIRELADRLDGKPGHAVERNEGRLEAMTDQELQEIIRGGSGEPETNLATSRFADLLGRSEKRSEHAVFGD